MPLGRRATWTTRQPLHGPSECKPTRPSSSRAEKGRGTCRCHGLVEARDAAGLASRERIDGVTADQSHDLAERLVAGNQHPARP